MMMRVEGKVAIITGGANGIGEATAKLFVAHGAHVIITDIDEEKGRRLSESLAPHADFLRCDVAHENDVRDAVDLAVEKYGRLHVMFNNAGIVGSVAPTPAHASLDDYDDVMAVNARGVLVGVKHAARAMIAGNVRGSILCNSSVSSVMALRGFPAYTVSKHAVVGIAKWAASDLAPHGILVNSISAFVLSTFLGVSGLSKLVGREMSVEETAQVFERSTDMKCFRLGVDDLANAALFLGSDESRFISGHNLIIDGAFSAARSFVSST